MPAASLTQAIYLLTLCSPKCDRALYRSVRRMRPRKIVELGVGNTSRANRLLRLAARYRPDETIEYTGIDLFETGPPDESISLKLAHHRLSQTGASVRLVPGDLPSGLARTANMLAQTDLLVIDSNHSEDDLKQAWFYVPRMIHQNTMVAQYQLLDGALKLSWRAPQEIEQSQRAA